MKESKQNFRDQSERAKELKATIEDLKEKFELLQQSANKNEMDEKVIEEEQFTLIKKLKAFKKEHRARVQNLKTLKAEIQSTEYNILNVNTISKNPKNIVLIENLIFSV